jgi:hypothetical protein
MQAAHPVEIAAVGAVGLARLARAILVPAVCLVLTIAGWQPAQTSQPQPAAAPMAAQPAPKRLTVVQLRAMARANGHRALARSGRRADLLAVLKLA